MPVNYRQEVNGKWFRTDGRKELGRDCPMCGCSCKVEHHGLFKDELSLKEFRITGLCQSCQDEVFQYTEED